MTDWTIRIALLLFVAGAIGRIRWREPDRVDTASRMLWTAATGFYLAHVFFAFHLVHGWSHEEAVRHTAEQSESVTGLRYGNGIWFNHAVTLICLLETYWWWKDPLRFQTRPAWINWLVYGFLVFMTVNGAIIFASGLTRWISVACLVFLAFLGLKRRIFPEAG